MSEELKPCPFCGNSEDLTVTCINNSTCYRRIECKKCDYNRYIYGTKQDAIRYWNTRPAEDALKAGVTRYRRALHNLKEDCTRRKHFAVSDEEKLFLYETISHIEAELDFNIDTRKGGEDE